jgi:molecular chaperone IbpA
MGPGIVSPDAVKGPAWFILLRMEIMTMRGFDLTPYRRSTVGFDRLFDLIENNSRLAQGDNYPPFNIERLSEDRYRVTLAVAGFRPEEIDITAQQNLLQVVGRKDDAASDRSKFLHVGIANRSFERRFELADFVRVEKADLADGLLTIELLREVPEAMKPKKIAVNGGQLVDINAQDRSAA